MLFNLIRNLKKSRYFKSGKGEYGEGDIFIGISMGDLFALSKTFIDMKTPEIANCWIIKYTK
jgi:hypothetical protein